MPEEPDKSYENCGYYTVYNEKPPSHALVSGPGRRTPQPKTADASKLPDGSISGFGLGMDCQKVAQDSELFHCLEKAFGWEAATVVISLGAFYLSGSRSLTALQYFTATQMRSSESGFPGC